MKYNKFNQLGSLDWGWSCRLKRGDCALAPEVHSWITLDKINHAYSLIKFQRQTSGHTSKQSHFQDVRISSESELGCWLVTHVTANLIGSIEELHRMRLKTGSMLITNNYFGETILSCFRSEAQQSLAKLQICKHLTTESKLDEEEGLFEFIKQKDVLWMNVMISCCALSCWNYFCTVVCTKLNSNE